MFDGLEKDLKRIVKGDVLCDEVSRDLYSTAACIFRIRPAGVVVPRDRDDVVRVVRYAAERGIPLTPRGGGTGLAGQTLGEGIVLDFSKYMNRILETHQVQSWVRVQPGVVLGDLNRYLKQFGLWFAPDPSSGDQATLGGMIGNNAAGSRTVKYGSTRDYVLGLECVMDDGSLSGQARWKEVEARVSALTREKRALIDRSRPEVLKNSSGYHLYDPQFDINRLIVGSEGTLAVVTEAKLRLIRRPAEISLVRMYFDDLVKTNRAVQALRPLGPSTLEVIDKTMIDLVRGSEMEVTRQLPENLKAILLCEFDGERREEVVALAEKAAGMMGEAMEVKVASGADSEALWKVRKAASPILDRMRGTTRSTRIIEDAAVHPDRMAAYFDGLKGIFKKHAVDGILFGHAGSGNFHVNVIMNTASPEDHSKIRRICEDVADLVASLKGTLSGEHGDGILRAAYGRKIFGDLVPVFEEVKRIFDPKGILNPGKKIRPEDFDFTEHMRPWLRPGFRRVADSPFLPWAGELEFCNGCGTCRTYCPVYLEVPDEAAAPRGKAAAFMGALSGSTPADPARLREVADLCINCKLCLVLCPTRVDIPGACLEAKAFDVSRNGLSRRDAMFVQARENSARGAYWAPLSNWVMPVAKWALGVARAPRFVRADVKPSKKSDRKVIYYPGCYADFNDPLGEKLSTIRVLERNGFEVVIPEYRCCGLSATSLGAREAAVERAKFNVELLSGWDLPIVTSAPSCGLALKMEMPRLLPDERAQKVADRVVDVHDFLWGLHEKGELDAGFKRISSTIYFHPTCHMRAMGAHKAARKLLGLVPGLKLMDFPERCCGMAGAFGMKSENYDLSMKIGGHVFADIKAKNPTLLAAANGPCRCQIQDGTGREVMHTLTLLDRAYGHSSLAGFHKVHEGAALESLKDYFDTGHGDE
jgi:FAD/FMN-containing dehydrogenase/Fe-S oxidoreductase